MCHALIIEDDFLAADYLGALAELSGAKSHVTTATEDQAVAAARARRPDIIVSDVRLGDGCGRRAVQRIHEALGPVTVMFVTGHTTFWDNEPQRPAILAKPFLRDEFVARFRSLALLD